MTKPQRDRGRETAKWTQGTIYHLCFKMLFIWLSRVLAAVRGIFCGRAWTLQLWCLGSVVAARRLRCSKSGGILVPQAGIEPTSPALQGRFSTTGPPRKSLLLILYRKDSCVPSSPTGAGYLGSPHHTYSFWGVLASSCVALKTNPSV